MTDLNTGSSFSNALLCLQTEVFEWNRRNFPVKSTYQPLLGLVEEVGELSHAHLKHEQRIRGAVSEHIKAKQDAVGDIVIYLVDYCNQNGLDFSYCVATAWNEVRQRDWVKFPKNGRSE